MVHLQHMQMHVDVDEFIFVLTSAGICNKLWRTMCMYARTWFKHVARQNKRDKDNTAQRLAGQPKTLYLSFRVLREKGESEVK